MNCMACPLHEHATTNCMSGRGQGEVIVVGEAPGAYEDALGQPFVGRSGVLLNSMLTKAGFDPDQVRFTNSVRCRPKDNAKPTPAEINICRSYLVDEIARLRPRIVIAFGDPALRSLTGKTGISARRGASLSFLPVYDTDALLFATFHPAYVLRQPQREHTVVSDLIRFRKAYEGLAQTSGIEDELTWEWWNGQTLSGTVSWDVETSYWTDGLSNVTQWAVSDGTQTYVSRDVPAIEAFKNSNGLTHNGWQADIPWVRDTAGIRMPRGRDTMVLAYLDDESQPLNLEDLCVKYLGVPGWKDEGHAAEQGSQEFALYNARDAFYTHRLGCVLLERLGSRVRVADYIINPAHDALRVCSQRGVWIDQEAVSKAREHYTREVETWKEYLSTWGIENPNSDREVGNLIISQGHTLPKTETGQWSVSKDALAVFPNTGLFEGLRSYAAAQQRMSFFVNPYARAGETEDKRVHPEYTLWRTVTGRTSSRKPNIQQVARDEMLRAMLAAPPGHTLLHADYGTVEIRIAAWVANERYILEQYARDPHWDIHSWMATRIYGLPEDAVPTGHQRQIAKSANFGLLYMATAETLHDYILRTTGIDLPIEECRRIRSVWHATFPAFGHWYKRVERELLTYGYVESCTGRRRHYGNPSLLKHNPSRNDFLREAVNFQVQSPSADIALLGLTAAVLYGVPANGFYHDAISAEVALDDVDRMVPIIEEALITAPVQSLKRHFGIDLDVPLTIEVKAEGRKWKLPLSSPPRP